MKKQVKFSNYLCEVVLAEYRNGGTSISLIDKENGEPVATASAWIEGLDQDEIAIKDYSENTGMLRSLVNYGIVRFPHRFLNGFPIVKLAV